MMALLAFMFSFSPFTPAIILAVIAIPLAVASSALGVFRLAITTLYFACAAWVPILIARDQIDQGRLFIGNIRCHRIGGFRNSTLWICTHGSLNEVNMRDVMSLP